MLKSATRRSDPQWELLEHDLKDALNVYGLGLEALRTVRSDPQQLHQLCQALLSERERLSRLLSELLIAVREVQSFADDCAGSSRVL